MNNKEIYKRTLTFSIRRLLWDLLATGIIAVASILGFLILNATTNNGLVGLAVGVIIGIIIVAIISHFISYIFKAGQIAMMTQAITENKLPDNVYDAGKKIVKARFLTVAAYYAATKATLEGGVLFFKHGKTLAKNLGRVFGIGIISFIGIGGVFFGLFYLITLAFPGAFESLAAEFSELATQNSDIPEFLTNAQNLMLITAGIGGIVMWAFLHSTFVRPFVLVGVLRNYIEPGKTEKITESDFSKLDGRSKKFKKLHTEAEAS